MFAASETTAAVKPSGVTEIGHRLSERRRDLRRSSCAIGTHAEDLHDPTLRTRCVQQVFIVGQPNRVELARAARRQPREGPLVEVPQPQVLIFVACDNRQSGIVTREPRMKVRVQWHPHGLLSS